MSSERESNKNAADSFYLQTIYIYISISISIYVCIYINRETCMFVWREFNNHKAQWPRSAAPSVTSDDQNNLL